MILAGLMSGCLRTDIKTTTLDGVILGGPSVTTVSQEKITKYPNGSVEVKKTFEQKTVYPPGTYDAEKETEYKELKEKKEKSKGYRL